MKAFLETRTRETTFHDYKRELPAEADKIAKTLVSFANTIGGVMLVGVDQADDGGPVLPAIGVTEPERDLARLQQIANERVEPPLQVDLERVQIPPGEPNAGNHILLVRVPESAQAPHAVVANGGIYVRRGDHSSKEREVFPPLKTLELLMQRRQGPETLREELWKRAAYRMGFNEMMGPRFVFGVGPVFPRAPCGTEARVRELVVAAYQGAPVRTVVGGAHADDDGNMGSPTYYAELFTHGFHLESGKFPHDDEYLDLEWLTYQLGGCWRRGRGFLEALGVHGMLRLRVELQNVGGRKVKGLGDTTSLESGVRHEETINSWTFGGDNTSLVTAIRQLRWGLGHHMGYPGEEELARRALYPR